MELNLLLLAVCAIGGYLLGDIQTGLVISSLSGVDLRSHGSGSSGATNALRVLGKRSAILTFVGDFLKGAIASGLGLLICGFPGGMVAAVAVICGHIWPAFYRFKGGKGVATSIGALVVLLPWHTLLMLAVGVIVLLLTKIVSLASISGATVFLIAGVVTAITRQDWFLLAFSIIMPSIVIFAHRSNIGRLMRGQEKRITDDIKKKND